MLMASVDPVVASGLFALAGVVVGGALPALFEGWRGRRQDQRDFRTAARLIRKDLELTAIRYRNAAEGKRGFGPASLRSKWRENEQVIAAKVGRKDWRTMRRGFILLEVSEHGYRKGADLSDEEAKTVAGNVKEIENAARLLGELSEK
jgi:hypothetical protein